MTITYKIVKQMLCIINGNHTLALRHNINT